MSFTTTIRTAIQTASLQEARRATLRMIRLAAKKQIWRYAQRHWIVDFNDAVVTQRHRNARDSIISDAMVTATSVNDATTIAEVLIVFDSISQFL